MRSESLVLAVVVLLMMLGGCALERTQADNSAVDALAGVDDELDFWDDIAERRVLTNNDALHGLLLVAADGDPASSYGGRLNAAKQRGWVGRGADLPADESASMGMIAVATCEILEIRGGLTMSIFGRSSRYCTRELVYRELIPPRTENQSLTGLEFIDLISQIEDELGGNQSTVDSMVASDE